MPRILDEKTVDPFAEEAAAEIAAADEREAELMSVDDAVAEVQGGIKVTEGRASVRRAWSWNGTESMLPLGWNPEGTRNDGALPYLLKRHGLCCGNSGFRGRKCPNCVKNLCANCKSSTTAKQIIKNFYLNPEEVPHQEKFYGDVDCFLPSCPRRGGIGFKTAQDMRVHAMSRHKMEYQAFREAEEADKSSEVDDLRKRIEQLTGLLITQKPTEQEKPPLYVSKKDKEKAAGGVAT